jgi:ribosome-associated protein
MADMEINEALHIPDGELRFSFARSGGPGGQNVNKVASKAILHWNLEANTTLPGEVKDRLRAQQANRITAEGDLVIQGQRFRDQAQNVEDCRARLREFVLRALRPPVPRKATRPTRGSRMRRLEGKKQQSERKERRKYRGEE